MRPHESSNMRIYGATHATYTKNGVIETITLKIIIKIILPPFQNACRFDFSKFISFVTYLDICYI